MIEVHIRDKNKLIGMIHPGKMLLRGRTGHSAFFYNPVEYLQAALGLCIGGKIVDYCRFNDLDPKIFQSVVVNTKDSAHVITIQHPESLEEEHFDRIKRELVNCTIAKQLTTPVELEWTLNDIPLEELVKEEKGGCCGS